MVKDLLIELAEDVPNYADPDRALARYRRTRRRRRLVGSAAAVVLVAGLTVSVALRRPPAPDQPAPAVPCPVSLTEYPPTLVEQEHREPLPDGPVGSALLLYNPRSPELFVVVLRDGRQYDVDDFGLGGTPSLSPNGRWLVRQVDSDASTAFAIRDLVAGGVRTIDPDLTAADGWEPMTWSPDGRFLLLWNSFRYARIELATGRTVRYQTSAGLEVLAMYPGGDLLVGPPDAVAPVTLRRIDPVTGRERGRVTVGAHLATPGGLLGAQEHLVSNGPQPALIAPGGDRVALHVSDTPQSGPNAVLVVDLGTGRVLARQSLWQTPAVYQPDQAPDAVARYAAEGILLVRSAGQRGLMVFDVDANQARMLTGLPDDVVGLLLPGGHTRYHWS